MSSDYFLGVFENDKTFFLLFSVLNGIKNLKMVCDKNLSNIG